jgi:hypothetical protein
MCPSIIIWSSISVKNIPAQRIKLGNATFKTLITPTPWLPMQSRYSLLQRFDAIAEIVNARRAIHLFDCPLNIADS